MKNRIAALAAIAGLIAGVAPALAQSPHRSPALPSTNPVQPQPGGGTQNNPNGQPPIGRPSTTPSIRPSGMPSARPSVSPSAHPSTSPSAHPSTSPSAHPSTSPSAHPSTSPSAHPSTSPSAVPSASPSPLNAKPARGTLISVVGTTATIKTANGTSRKVTVSAKTAAVLKHRIGKNIVYRIVNGALVLVGNK